MHELLYISSVVGFSYMVWPMQDVSHRRHVVVDYGPSQSSFISFYITLTSREISNANRITPAYDDLARKYQDVLFLKVLETECQELMVRWCYIYHV